MKVGPNIALPTTTRKNWDRSLLSEMAKHTGLRPEGLQIAPLTAPLVRSLRLDKKMELVEAAGVEPASEKARHEENYVRSRFSIFSARLRSGKSSGRLVRLISASCSGPKHESLSRKMTLTHRRAGSAAGAAA